MPSSLQVVVGSSSFSIQLWWEAPPCSSLVMLRSSNEPYEMKERSVVVSGPCTNEGVGMELQHLLSTDVDLSCWQRKQLTGEVASVCVVKYVKRGRLPWWWHKGNNW